MDMPVKHKKPSIAAQAAARTARFPKLPEHLLDGLVEGPMSAMEVEDLIDAFGKAVIERAMAGEMNAHLGYRAGEDKPAQQADERNGVSAKTLLNKDRCVLIPPTGGTFSRFIPKMRAISRFIKTYPPSPGVSGEIQASLLRPMARMSPRALNGGPTRDTQTVACRIGP
ncbi:transposase [Castellaniella sp.]|uniref:transposase n=1 Tax=Castellaniella sp. TaxID=1955812 RepID=UPI003A4C588E